MKAYLNTILNTQWENMLPLLPANSVEAFITDPQYGTASESKIQKNRDELVEFNLEWDRDLPLAWIDEAYRITKPGGALIAFTDNKRTETVWNYLEKAGFNPLQHIYWRKINPPPQPRKNFCSAIETAIFARKPGKIIYWAGGGTTHNVIEAPICTGPERTAHPTQKPLSVMAKLIMLVCPPGGTVVDPFVGSGTTAVAAFRLDRNFICCEKNPAYYALAEGRLTRALAQPKLFTELYENLKQAEMDMAG